MDLDRKYFVTTYATSLTAMGLAAQLVRELRDCGECPSRELVRQSLNPELPKDFMKQWAAYDAANPQPVIESDLENTARKYRVELR